MCLFGDMDTPFGNMHFIIFDNIICQNNACYMFYKFKQLVLKYCQLVMSRELTQTNTQAGDMPNMACLWHCCGQNLTFCFSDFDNYTFSEWYVYELHKQTSYTNELVNTYEKTTGNTHFPICHEVAGFAQMYQTILSTHHLRIAAQL